MMLTGLFDMVGAHMLEHSGPEHHTLIDTGPYAFIRHPIDSGLSWMTAQLPAPIAIAEADAAAAKGLWAAIVELILKPAMVGAIGPAAERIDGAMIAKPRRQCQWTLPIRLHDGGPRQGTACWRRSAERRGNNTARK